MSRGEARLSVGVAAVAVGLALAAAASRPLMEPDETIYGEVVREMGTTGDRLVPRYLGVRYTEKPPGYFWAMGAAGAAVGRGSALFGVLPAALSTAILALLLAAGRGGILGGEAGPLSAALFAASVLGSVAAAACRMDALFALLIAGSIVCGAGPPASVRPRVVLAGALAGLAVVVKGPYGLLLPAASLAALWVLEGRRPPAADLALGIVAFLAVLLAWFGPALAAEGGGYLDEILGRQIAQRAVSSRHRAEPSWYYLALFPACFFPGVLFLPAGLREALRARDGRERACLGLLLSPLLLALPGGPIVFLATAILLAWRFRPAPRELRDAWLARAPEDRFLLVWLLVPFLAMSLVSAKNAIYLVPVLPPAAILAARGLLPGRSGDGALARAFRSLPRAALAALALAGAALAAAALVPGLLPARAREQMSAYGIGPGVLLVPGLAAGAAGAASFLFVRGRPALAALAWTGLAAGAGTVVVAVALPVVVEGRAIAPLAARFREASRGKPLVTVDLNPRATAFPFGSIPTAWRRRTERRTGLGLGRPSEHAFVSDADLRQILAPLARSSGAWILADSRELDAVRRALPRAEPRGSAPHRFGTAVLLWEPGGAR